MEVGGGIGAKVERVGKYKVYVGIQIRQELAAPPRKLDAEGFTPLIFSSVFCDLSPMAWIPGRGGARAVVFIYGMAVSKG